VVFNLVRFLLGVILDRISFKCCIRVCYRSCRSCKTNRH